MKVNMSRSPTPANLELVISILTGFISNLDDVVSSVIYGFFFVRVVYHLLRTQAI